MEQKNLPHADHPMKRIFIDEVNALGLPELHLTNLYVLQGALVNQTYSINGNEVKLLDDNATYWGNQVQRQNGANHRAMGATHLLHRRPRGQFNRDKFI